MNIRSIFGIKSQLDKIKEYRSFRGELEDIEKSVAILADSYSLQKASIDDLGADTDPEIRLNVMNKFNSFIEQQRLDVTTLCNRRAKILKSMEKLEQDEEIKEAIEELKGVYECRDMWKKGKISKAIYFDLLKAKTNKIHYSDILVFREGKLLILQRTKEGGGYSPDWCIPGGHIDPGEEPREAAKRELYEETGIDVPEDALQEVALYDKKGCKIHYYIVYLPSDSTSLVRLDAAEHFGSMWINPVEDLKKYQFIFNMGENIKNILGLQSPSFAPKILKSFLNGDISENVLKEFAKSHPDEIEKAEDKTYFSHKERKDLAKKGEAMPNGKYPIRNASDLEDAIALVGRSNMPESEVKAWIKKRAKELKLEDELPSSWKDKVEKTMSAESTQGLAKESVEEDTKNSVDNKEKEEGMVEENKIEKSTDGFGIFVKFDDLEEASLFKSLVDEWKSSGKLSHIESVHEVENLEKAISFTRKIYESTVREVEEGPSKTSYGEFTMNYRDDDGGKGEKFEDFLGTLQKVTSMSTPFSITLKTKDNGEQEWKWKGNFHLNSARKIANIEKSFENDDLEKSEKSQKDNFNKYLNFLEGCKTRLKNIHWGEEDNSKHVYLDSLIEEVSEFEDKIAEAGQADFGRFKDGEIEAEEVTESDPIKICDLLFSRSVKFRKTIDGMANYTGEISWIDDFLASLKQSKYRLQMH